jgi:predicted neutral ceramidase superfamily lipid hydrolase
MNSFTRSISQISKGAVKAFQTFPAALACAVAFAIVTMIRIQLDWPQQEAYNLLFNCLHWAFALGAVFSLAAITAAQSRFNTAKAFLTANLLGAAAAVVTFLLLYLFGGTDQVQTASRVVSASGLSASRVGVAILVSFIAFIILAGYPKAQSDFARSFFMTQKALLIALIYGGVIMAGTSGVAGAFRPCFTGI